MFNKKNKHININIGTVIFGALFLYLVITVIIYLTADHISSYQVTSGPLSKNETYTALAMRSEEVVNATTGGYVSYFLAEDVYKRQRELYPRFGNPLFRACFRRNHGSHG